MEAEEGCAFVVQIYKTTMKQYRLLSSTLPCVQAGLQLLSSNDWQAPDCKWENGFL